jgi:pSer/pThr/pTyr-binding forkhead associated (FHA) protein
MDSDRKATSAALLIVSSSRVYSFEKQVIKIGRLEDNDLIIDDPRVSRNHAELRFHEGHYMIIDLHGRYFCKRGQNRQTDTR